MTNSNKKPTKANTLAHVQAIIAGTQKHFPSSNFTIGNASFTSASLIKLFQSLVDALTALEAAQKGAKDALTACRTTNKNVGPTLRAFERIVEATFGDASQPLADFDLAPRKAPRPLTSDQKAAKAARARATRKLRGTTGPRQKLRVQAPAEIPQTVAPKA